MEQIASEDPLTGLANRRKLERGLEFLVNQSRAFSVIYVDLNGFKSINDTHGHQAGDDLLKQFAGELRAAFRTTDVVGRWGGDEFVILVDGHFRDAVTRAERIEKWVDGEYLVTTGAVQGRFKSVRPAVSHPGRWAIRLQPSSSGPTLRCMNTRR